MKAPAFLILPKFPAARVRPWGMSYWKTALIPHSRQLGKTGAGNMMIQQALELERAFIFAGICGVMDWQLDSVIKFSRERKVNGTHLGKNQAISHKIADMKLRLDTIRLWVNECARLKDNNKRITLASAQTKLFAAEAFLQSSLDAVHILGSSALIDRQPHGQTGQRRSRQPPVFRLFGNSEKHHRRLVGNRRRL